MSVRDTLIGTSLRNTMVTVLITDWWRVVGNAEASHMAHGVRQQLPLREEALRERRGTPRWSVGRACA